MGNGVKRSIYVGFDPREELACLVAIRSMVGRMARFIPVNAIRLDELQKAGIYTRPMETRDGRMWDVISEAPMATEHACARFLTPHLAKEGWAVFMDGDMLIRSDIGDIFEGLDPSKALYCVKHDHRPEHTVKMDGQVQTVYPRKNWSSVMVFNCDHPANAALTVELVNSVPGRDLHRFCWLTDDLIGELDPAWNWLVPAVDPKIAHFTEGVPDMAGYERQPYADEWRGWVS
ncbi:MAG: hypothetical protein WAW13_00370 [Minisyncoccia bacterium]